MEHAEAHPAPPGAHAHHDHEMPTEGGALTAVAASATLHCLTGCAIGEVAGVAIGTAAGFSDAGTIVLAIGLAFLFGYGLTSLPLLRAGLALSAVVPIALASDTLSIATMEVVDNAILLAIPGAMDAGLDTVLFWGSLSFALAVAGFFAFPVNRWLIARGKGHAAVHETGIHGGPPVRVVAIVFAVAAVFGTAVLIGEAIDGGTDHTEGGDQMLAESGSEEGSMDGHGTPTDGEHATAADADPVRGLAVADGGMTLELDATELDRGKQGTLRFEIAGEDGQPVEDFEVEHEREMHLILARRDLTGFQHLHPRMNAEGVWSTPVTIPEAGSYRVFADFVRGGTNYTLAADLAVDGVVDWRDLPAPAASADAGDGYEVRLDGAHASAGAETSLRFEVRKDGEVVGTDPYLGAGGHLVALREGDLAFLHVHPTDEGGDSIAFATEFPTPGAYRLFLQFKHAGEIHTAAFTQEVG
jgi:hypothetical protein